MKTTIFRLSLVLVVLMITFASCERDVIYVEKPFISENNEGGRGTSGTTNGNTGNTGNNATGKSMDIQQPALTPPLNPGLIKASEIKSAGNITVANGSRQYLRVVNLGFTFTGAGASAVDSLFYTIRGYKEVGIKVVDNKFAINGINLPASTFTDVKLDYKIKPSIPSNISEGSQITLSLSSFSTDETGVTKPNSGTFPNPINLDKVSLIPNDNGGDNGNDNGDNGGNNDNDNGNDNGTQATIIQTGWFSYLRTPALVAEKNTEADVMIHVIQLQMTGPGPARIRSIKFTNPYSAFNTVAGNDFKFMKDWGFDLNDRNRINFEVNVTNQNTFTVNFPVKDIPANGIYQRISIFAGVKNSGNRFDSGAFTHGKFGLKITSKSDIDIRDSAGNKIDLSKVNVWLDGTAIN